MLSVTKEQSEEVLTVSLSGAIEETANFEELIGQTPKEVCVNTKNVPRINSIGVKAWIKYFQALSGKGVKIRLVECSTAIVEQINLISNFTCGGNVESIYVPFSCTQCQTELVGLFDTKSLKDTEFELPSLKCSKCGSDTEFDDIPEEYFSFLMD